MAPVRGLRKSGVAAREVMFADNLLRDAQGPELTLANKERRKTALFNVKWHARDENGPTVPCVGNRSLTTV